VQPSAAGSMPDLPAAAAAAAAAAIPTPFHGAAAEAPLGAANGHAEVNGLSPGPSSTLSPLGSGEPGVLRQPTC
jgi:hypothetical protein